MEDESGLSAEEADEEVAVTKRGRHVKMPAKYKAEVACLCLLIPRFLDVNP